MISCMLIHARALQQKKRGTDRCTLDMLLMQSENADLRYKGARKMFTTLKTGMESSRLQANCSDRNDLRPRAEDFNKVFIYLYVHASSLTCLMTQPYLCDNCSSDLGV